MLVEQISMVAIRSEFEGNNTYEFRTVFLDNGCFEIKYRLAWVVITTIVWKSCVEYIRQNLTIAIHSEGVGQVGSYMSS